MQLSSLLGSWPCRNPSGPLSGFFRGIRAGLLRISASIVMHVLKTYNCPHFLRVFSCRASAGQLPGHGRALPGNGRAVAGELGETVVRVLKTCNCPHF